MDEYMEISGGTIFDGSQKILTSLNGFKDIQDAIDQINLDAVVGGDNGITFGSISTSAPSDLNAYKADLEALELVNKDTKNANKTKAEILDEIEVALKAIDTAREKADEEIVKAQAALDAYAVAFGDDYDKEQKYIDVVTEIEKLQKDDLKASELATTTLEGKVTALKAATLELTIISDTLAAVDEFEAAFKVNNDTDFKNEVVYKAIFLDAGDGNGGDPILVETTPGSGVYEFGTDSSSDAYTSANLIDTSVDPATGPLVDLRKATAEWVTYNAAIATKDAAEMRTLLFDLQPASEFTNLTPNAAKAEFAQYVIDELAEEATAPANFTVLQGKIFTSGYLKDYTDKISAVNGASDIADMITALEAISEDYDKLGAEAKADIAGDVFEVKADLKTFADIVTAMGL